MTEEHSDAELIEILKKTKQLFGALYPVLVAPDGTVIDGKHRLEADAEWPKVTVDWLIGTQDVEMLRLISNWIRRDIPTKEKAESLAKIAELTGWTPKEISENLGIPYTTIVRYLPERYKDSIKAKAGRLGGLSATTVVAEQRIATVAIQDEKEEVKSLAEEEHAVEPTPAVEDFLEQAFAKAVPGREPSREWLISVLGEQYDLSSVDAEKRLTKFRKARSEQDKIERETPSEVRVSTPLPVKTEEEDSATKLGKYYPYEIIDEVVERLPNATFETLLKYCRSFVSILYAKASLDLRQAVLEEFIR